MVGVLTIEYVVVNVVVNAVVNVVVNVWSMWLRWLVWWIFAYIFIDMEVVWFL